MRKNGFFLFWALVFFSSCRFAGKEMHIYDSHAHSYKVIKDYVGSSPAPALVLFDYYPGVERDPARRYGWIGGLLSEGVISAVYWVSEFSAENRNYEAEIARFDEIFSPAFSQTAGQISRISQIAEKIRVMDFKRLEQLKLPKDSIVSVDAAVFEYEKQTPPSGFLARVLRWIRRQDPRLLTVSLTGGERRFSCLTEIIQSRNSGTAIYLESETPAERFAASSRFFQVWRSRPDPWVWYSLPEQCVELLKKKNIIIKGENRENILAVWNDPGYKKLRESYGKKRQEEILQSAREGVFKFWNDAEIPALPPLGSNEGLAVRLLVHGNDRGCLAWYKNSGDMNLFAAYCAAEALRDPRYETVNPGEAENTFLELSIFGDWEDMPSPRDFIPGYHNLWLSNGGRNTILQASLVPQRNYTKEDFLENICKKAGLGKNAWKENANLRWKRSPGLWLVEPLVGPSRESVTSPRKSMFP